MLLFLDLETSGLIRKDVPLGEPSQPWAVKVAADMCGADGRSWTRLDVLVKPDGRKIKEGAEEVHGISSADAERYGLSENTLLAQLFDIAGKVKTVVSYGSFDRQVVESLAIRLEHKLGKPKDTYRARWVRPGLEFVDLMVPWCQQVCRLPSKVEFSDEYAWPSLDVAIERILGETPDRSTHDAWDDLTFTKRIYFALRERGMFDGAAA